MSTRYRSTINDIVVDPVTIGRLFVPVLVVVIWEVFSRWLGADLLPGPDETFGMIQHGIEAGWVVGNLQNTMIALAVGFAIAVVGGLGLGLALGLSQPTFDVLEIYVLSTYSIPKIILYPIFLFIFQLGMDNKIAFAAVHGIYPMLIITMGAIREVDDIYRDVARSLRMSWWQLFRFIIIPFILVQLVVALRLAFSLTFLGVILAELFASKSGLGLVLQHAMANADSSRIMAIVTILIVIAIIGNITFYAAQRVLEDRWNMTAGTGGI